MADWTRLPHELWRYILSLLADKDLGNARRSCSVVNASVTSFDSSFWNDRTRRRKACISSLYSLIFLYKMETGLSVTRMYIVIQDCQLHKEAPNSQQLIVLTRSTRRVIT